MLKKGLYLKKSKIKINLNLPKSRLSYGRALRRITKNKLQNRKKFQDSPKNLTGVGLQNLFNYVIVQVESYKNMFLLVPSYISLKITALKLKNMSRGRYWYPTVSTIRLCRLDVFWFFFGFLYMFALLQYILSQFMLYFCVLS